VTFSDFVARRGFGGGVVLRRVRPLLREADAIGPAAVALSPSPACRRLERPSISTVRVLDASVGGVAPCYALWPRPLIRAHGCERHRRV